MKKRSNKVLLLTGLATVTIGAAGILHTNYMQPPQIGLAKTQTYNYHPNNILDNVFEQDNVKYLPFIFESPNQKITKEFITSEFAKKGLTITSQLNAVVGTGTKITVRENNTVYTVVVYGDVNGNGEVNLVDAQLLILHYRKTQTITQKANLIAGNVSNDNGNSVINLVDAQRVIMFKKESKDLDKLVVKEPASIKETDKTEPVITILGQSQVTLEEGDSYTDQGATAKDNYDGDVTAEISTKIQFVANGSSQIQTVGQVDTSKVGTYTIVYTVSDSNGNTATATRTVIIKEKEIVIPPTVQVTKIELLELPANFKTIYQYGENLDLTDVQIKVYKDDNTTEIKPVTKDMVSEYTLTTAGERNITVTYSNKLAEATIDVTVLNKISELVITNNSGLMSNITKAVAVDTYNITSKVEFTLGAIEAKAGENVSTLQFEQLKLDEVEGLSINKASGSNGEILLTGTATKEGVYVIRVYIQYNENDIVEKEITLIAKKSATVEEVLLTQEESKEIIKIGKAAKRGLTFINDNEEEIEVRSSELTIDKPEGITIDRITIKNGEEWPAETSDFVKKLKIGTTAETGNTFTIKIKITGTNQEFPFDITTMDKSVLNEIQLDAKELTDGTDENILKLYTVVPSDETESKLTEADENGNIYTMITPKFIDQDGIDFKITEDNIVESDEIAEIEQAVAEGKIGILLPEVSMTVDGEAIPIPGTIDVKYGQTTGTIENIRFGIILSEEMKLDLKDLNDNKKVIIKYKNANKELEEIELPIRVKYKETTELTLKPSETLTVDTNGCYEMSTNNEQTVGVVTVEEREKPLTADMLTAEIAEAGNNNILTEEEAENKIKVSYVEENGKVLMKVTILTPDVTYRVRAKLKDKEVFSRGINMKGTTTIEITEIGIDNFSVELGGAPIEKLLSVSSNQSVPTEKNPNGQEIKAGEISFEQLDKDGGEVNYLTIERLDKDGYTINPTTDVTTPVKKIRITATGSVTQTTTVTVKIILFKDRTDVVGKKTKDITVTLEKLVPTDINLGEDKTNSINIELYNSPTTGTTPAPVNEMVYTLIPIELLSNGKTMNNVNRSLFTDDASDKANKVYIQCPTAENIEVLSVKYFKDDKGNEATNTNKEKVRYLGIAKTELLDVFYDSLTSHQIKLICGTTTEEKPSATITFNYTPQTTK